MPNRYLIHLFLVVLLLVQGAVADTRAYEDAADLDASSILPTDLFDGEHHTVASRVRNDGYLNYYVIKSDYGEFDVTSTAMLKVRIGEINALAELEELSKTEVFAKAMADAGMKQIKSLQQFATHPVETVKGIPSGVGRMFKRFTRQAGEAVDATKEFVAGDDEEADDENKEEGGDEADDSNAAVDLTESVLGVDKAQRNWSRKLGTDPYSSNEVLQAAIKEVAWAERLGKLGMGFAGVPKIPGADIISDVNEAVWSKDPYELRDLNQSRLVATGADEALIEEYLDNPQMTPSQQTLLTAAIAEFEDVDGRDGILLQSLNLETEAEMIFFIQSLTLLAWYHRNQNPLASFETNAAIPVAILPDGAAVLALAVDHLYWTETIAQAAKNYAGSGTDEQSRELWLLGTASDRALAALDAQGFDVHVGAATMMTENGNIEEQQTEASFR